MLKYLLGALHLLLASSTFASSIYVLGGASNQHLRYDVDGWIQSKLSEGRNPDYLRVLRAVGGKDEVSIDQTGTSYKLGIGYNFSAGTAAELSYRAYGTSSAGIVGTMGFDFDEDLSYRNHYARLQASLFAAAGGSGAVDARGFGLSIVQRVHQPLFIRLGVEYVEAKLVTRTFEGYSFQYYAELDGDSISGQGGEYSFEEKVKYKRIVLPLFGGGLDYKLTKNVTLRAEFERVGSLKEGFDFYTISALYRF